MACHEELSSFVPQNDFSEDYFLHHFEVHFQAKLNELCKEKNLPYVDIKNVIYRAALNRRGDFSLTLKNKDSSELLLNVDSLVEKLRQKDFIAEFSIESSKLILNLNRTFTFRNALQEVLTLKEKTTGKHLSKHRYSTLVINYNENKSLCSLRNRLISEHLISFLALNDILVYCKNYATFHVPYSSGNVKHIECSEKCVKTNKYDHWEEIIKQSKWLSKSNDSTKSTILDGKQFLHGKTLGLSYKNIGDITIKRETYTRCFEYFLEIVHFLDDHLSDGPKRIFHVVPQNLEFTIQQSGLLLEMLYDKNVRQSYIVHHKTVVKDHSNYSENDFLVAKKEELKVSLMHKYGPSVIQDKTWKSCLETLVQTAIKFDVFLTSLLVPLKLVIQTNKDCTQNKSGIFVQYNCARLAMLFRNYHLKVSENYYHQLPEIENVDFSVLKSEEEWSLLFNFVLKFPKLIEELLMCLMDDTRPKFLSHKICQMLVNLSRELSIYYSKVHILCGQQQHLQNKMVAQLYLLMGVHKVIKNGLMLLNIPDLQQM